MTTTATTTKVTIVGPNLPREAPATFEVHAAGCAHLKRGYLRTAIAYKNGGFEIDARSVHDVVDDMYGPGAGSFYQESATLVDGEWVDATWDSYVSEFHFAPCVKNLPYDHEEDSA